MNVEEPSAGGRGAREGLPEWLNHTPGYAPPAERATSPAALYGVLVEERMLFTLVELSHACGTDCAQLCELVDEGVLVPIGDGPQQWQFEGSALRRARTAARLATDLALNTHATAIVLDLLDEIRALRAQVRRHALR